MERFLSAEILRKVALRCYVFGAKSFTIGQMNLFGAKQEKGLGKLNFTKWRKSLITQFLRMTEYFNVLKNGHRVFESVEVALIMMAIGIALIILLIKKGAPKGSPVLVFLYLWTGGVILWTTMVFIITYSKYSACKRVMENKTYEEVEGFVENFQSVSYSPRSSQYSIMMDESFSVKGVYFSYPGNDDSYIGFNQSKSHDGPIDEGKYVRIRYYEDLILQLWVKD